MRSYQAMYDAYARIFTRLGLKFRAVEADTGAIGGFASHEFQVLADSGEDAIAWCPASDYAANVEQAEALAPAARARRAGRGDGARCPRRACRPARKSPRCSACRSRARVKCLMIVAQDDRVHMLLVRGDHMGNEVKIGKLPGLGRLALGERRRDRRGDRLPARLPRPGRHPAASMPLIVDRTVAAMADFVCGANEADFHLAGVNFGRDCREPDVVADMRNVVAGDPSPDGKGTLEILRGIEVGHVFALGTVLLEGDGRDLPRRRRSVAGASRWAATASASRASSPPRSSRTTTTGASSGRSRWRRSPWRSRPIGYDRSEAVRALADRLHDELAAAGVEVLLDDRGERPGVMFADLELIGIPHRITIGDRGLKEGRVEYQGRRDTRGDAGAGRRTSRALRCSGRARRSELNGMTRRRGSHRDLAAAGRARRVALAARAARAARAGAQAEEQLAPSVVAGPREGDRRRAGAGRLREPADAARVARRDVAPARAHASPTSASGATSSPPCTTKRRAPGSIRSWCSASSSTRAASGSTRSRSPARAATCR